MLATEFGAKGRAPARILVAEDDSDLRPMIALALSEAGFDVVEAEDGAILLEYLAGSLEEDGTLDKFDVIVSDIQMPGFTALDVLAGAQRFVTRTPILLVTAVRDPEILERARQLGAAGVLTKPIDVDELCLEVCRLLTRSMPGLNAT
jgi:CheY-like chemotaxis protein